MTLPPFIRKYLPKLPRGGDRQSDPARDWAILLASALILFFASVGWNAWFMFAALEEPEVAAPSIEDTGDTGIGAARAAAEVRALEEARYRSEYRFIDPSI